MNRKEYLDVLRGLLAELPTDERDAAVQYYNDYFDDAGPENEAAVMGELGNPARVADIIKSNLENDDRETGEFSEKGYEDSRFFADKNYPEKSGINMSSEQASGADEKASANEDNSYNWYEETKDRYANKAYDSQDYRSYEDSYKNSHEDQKTRKRERLGLGKIIVIAILGIMAISFVFSIAKGLIGFIFGLLGTIFGLGIGSAAGGVGLAIGGLMLIINGIILLVSFPGVGVFCIGIGLILLSLAVLMMLLTITIWKKFYPWLFRMLKSIFSKFTRKGVQSA